MRIANSQVHKYQHILSILKALPLVFIAVDINWLTGDQVDSKNTTAILLIYNFTFCLLSDSFFPAERQ